MPSAEYDYNDEEDAIDYSDLEAKYNVDITETFETVVVVDNVPVVEQEKVEKLTKVITTIFSKIGNIKEGGFHMPQDANGKTKGYCFIDFETPEQAKLAVKRGTGRKMDAKHILAVNMFDDIEKFSSMDDEYKEPETEKYVEKEHLRSWLTDPTCRDQWVMMKGDDVSIFWNNKTEQPELSYSRSHWSDTYVSWSPRGTYLATFHKQGIVLWGGPSWNKIMRFPHPNVKLIDFSPNEKYIVTWSYEPFMSDDGDQHHIAVWDLPTGQRLRSFPLDPSTLRQPDGADKAGNTASSRTKIHWPIFKWSFDDKYLARMTPGPQGMISVYETPGMGLMDKKSIKVENVQDFSWSPSSHVLAYWTPESGNIPARVTLMKVPSREIVRTKNLFYVVDCKMFWQSEGDYLLVKVDRQKTKKQNVTNFELFRMNEKDIPVDVVEFKNTETVQNVFWEPKGHRFAAICSEQQRILVNFYEMASTTTPSKGQASQPSASDISGSVKLLKQIERKGINQIFWSPQGRFCVLAGVRAFQGELEFWDADEMTLMNSGEHYMCTDVEWDPTGRYVISSVSWWQVQTDTGFTLWSFTGNKLATQTVPVFKQLLWRPRPPTLLTPEKLKKIRKNIKEYAKEFEAEDDVATTKASREVIERRERMFGEWKEYRMRCKEEFKKERAARVSIWGGFDPEEERIRVLTEEGDEDLEEWIEEVIDETVEEVTE